MLPFWIFAVITCTPMQDSVHLKILKERKTYSDPVFGNWAHGVSQTPPTIHLHLAESIPQPSTFESYASVDVHF